MVPVRVSMTVGYSQPGKCTIRPVASPLKSRAVPCTGAARFSRWQAAARATGSWSFDSTMTMWDMRMVPPVDWGERTGQLSPESVPGDVGVEAHHHVLAVDLHLGDLVAVG